MRHDELDALRWSDLEFTPGNESIRIERQWNVKAKKITEPKHGSEGTIAMVEPLRDRLWASRASQSGSSRPCVGTTTCPRHATTTEATRHYFASYLLNVAEMPDHVVAAQLRHDDGGTLVRELYGTRTPRWRASASGPPSAPRRRSRSP